MDWRGCFLPLLLLLSLLVIGRCCLALFDRSPSPQSVSTGSAQVPGLGDALLAEGHRLGITVKAGQQELPMKEAMFRAEPGRL